MNLVSLALGGQFRNRLDFHFYRAHCKDWYLTRRVLPPSHQLGVNPQLATQRSSPHCGGDRMQSEEKRGEGGGWVRVGGGVAVRSVLRQFKVVAADEVSIIAPTILWPQVGCLQQSSA